MYMCNGLKFVVLYCVTELFENIHDENRKEF